MLGNIFPPEKLKFIKPFKYYGMQLQFYECHGHWMQPTNQPEPN